MGARTITVRSSELRKGDWLIELGLTVEKPNRTTWLGTSVTFTDGTTRLLAAHFAYKIERLAG